MKITLDELALFKTIVESGSFTGAADRMNIAPSMVSRGLKRLETKLDSCLIQRSTRSISLTRDGQWLLQHASEVLADAEHIERHFYDSVTSPRGVVTMDAATPFTLHAVIPLIRGFREAFPDVEVVLASSESNINLIERRVDIAIRIGELESSGLHARKIGETRRKLFASPDYLKQFGWPGSVKDLDQHCCLGFSRPEKLNRWPVLDDTGVPLLVEPEIRADSGESLRHLALQGAGIACLSDFTVSRDLESGALHTVMVQQTIKQEMPIYLVYHSDKTASGQVRAMIDYITEHIQLNDQ